MAVSRKVASVFVLMIIAAVAIGGELSAAESVRTWTDATGTFSVRAKIVGFQAGVVRLTKEDGTTVSLPLDRLSAGDQAYVRAYDASNPFRPKTPGTTIGGTASPAGGSSAAPSAAPSGMASGVTPRPGSFSKVSGPQVVWADVPRLSLGSGTTPFKTTLSPVVPLAPMYERSFSLPSGQAFERLGGLWLDGQSSSGLLGLWYEPPQSAVSTRVMRIDLSSGRADKPVDLPAGATPIGWDGVGRRAVVRDIAGKDSNGAFLAVLGMTETGWDWLVTIKPFEPAQGPEQIVWAAFFQNERLATLSDTGRLVVWSLTTGEALAYERLYPDVAVRRSEDGRVLAFASGATVQFIDVTNLSPVGCLSGMTATKAIAFSPDGTQVAVRAQNGGIWKLADMSKVIEFDGSNVSGPMFFADSRSLFDGARMLDAATGVRIFEIKGSIGPSGSAGDKAWFVYEDKTKKTRMMNPEKPRPSNADEKIAAMGPEPKGFILPPNQPIRIDVKLLPKGEDHAKVQAHLEESVKKAGHEVDDNATMTLVASAWPQEKPTLIAYIQARERTWDDLRGPLSGFGSFGSGGFGDFPGSRPPGFPDLPRPPNFPRPPSFADDSGFPGMRGPGGTVVESVTIHAVFVIEMKLELDFLGETLWSTKAIPMQNRNKLVVPKDYNIEDFLNRLASDDLQTFLNMSVPKSIPRNSSHSRPACGYFELGLSGLVPSKEKTTTSKDKR